MHVNGGSDIRAHPTLTLSNRQYAQSLASMPSIQSIQSVQSVPVLSAPAPYAVPSAQPVAAHVQQSRHSPALQQGAGSQIFIVLM